MLDVSPLYSKSYMTKTATNQLGPSLDSCMIDCDWTSMISLNVIILINTGAHQLGPRLFP